MFPSSVGFVRLSFCSRLFLQRSQWVSQHFSLSRRSTYSAADAKRPAKGQPLAPFSQQAAAPERASKAKTLGTGILRRLCGVTSSQTTQCLTVSTRNMASL